MDSLNREQLTILSLTERQHKMTVADVYPLDADILPYENPSLRIVADRIVEAHRARRQVIWMMGAHVMRRGNSRFIIDLMERGIVTHIATNVHVLSTTLNSRTSGQRLKMWKTISGTVSSVIGRRRDAT